MNDFDKRWKQMDEEAERMTRRVGIWFGLILCLWIVAICFGVYILFRVLAHFGI